MTILDKKRNSSLASPLYYFLCSRLARLIFRLFCKVHLVILEDPPQERALLVASNHISHFEPALLSSFFPRSLDWIAMKELFHYSWSARFFSSLNVLPVDRFEGSVESNHRTIRSILKRLAQKRVIGIFPEGGIRSGTTSILEGAPMKPGLATLSLLAQAPIIPCVILGSDRLYVQKMWLRRPSLWIIIGKAIMPPQAASKRKKQALDSFQQELAAIFPKLQKELCARFQLSAEDLPKSPQERRAFEKK